MRKILFLLLIALGSVATYAKDIKEYVVTTTPQMSCQNCEKKIKGNLRFEKGVKKVETDLENQKVTVTYDAEKTNEKQLEEAFGKLNYKVTKVNNCDKAANGKHECTGEHKDGKHECTGDHKDGKEHKGDCCKDKK